MKCSLKIQFSLFTLVVFYCCCKDENIKPDPAPEWEKIPVFIPQPYLDFTDVEFYNNDFGVICGASGIILKTENGGEDWQTFNVGISPTLMCVFILSQQEFYTATVGLYKTNNGGDSFTELNRSSSGSIINGIHFFDSRTGLISEGNWIYKTTDGGQNWEAIYNKGYADKMQFVSDSIGYIYGGVSWDYTFYGLLHKTEDYGNSWSNIGNTPEVYNWEILSLYFLNEDTGYISNCSKEIFITYDGGITWTKRCENLPAHVTGLVFLTENVGYGVSYFGILKTMDGGINWSWDYKNDTVSFESISKTPDNKKVIAVGNDGFVLLKK
jgi:photosystem II stability/assembly factor-like uncharacterized protein